MSECVKLFVYVCHIYTVFCIIAGELRFAQWCESCMGKGIGRLCAFAFNKSNFTFRFLNFHGPFTLLVRGSYENLGSKSLPNNFFADMFVKVCTNIL